MNQIVFGIVILLVAGGVFWWHGPNQSGDSQSVEKERIVNETGIYHEVLLTEEGYKPESLSVGIGDVVIFSNETGRPFWPASNLHPSHRDYPKFDPREPIQSDEEWLFIFEQSGEWKYHDHLAPYFTGVIIVSE